MPRRVRLGTLFFIACIGASAQTAAVSFSKDVAPILTAKCMKCHAEAPMMANLDLRSRESALKGGQHGPAIVAGNAAASRLYQHLTGQQQPQMPLGGKLTDAEIATVKNWIDSGGLSVSGLRKSTLAFATVEDTELAFCHAKKSSAGYGESGPRK